MSTATSNKGPIALAIVVVVAVIAAFCGAFVLFFATSKADGGHVIVIRNGGLFDDNSIRQVVQPNSGLTYTGLWSHEHPYPTSQRNFKVSADGKGDSNEQINVPTKDGVSLGIEGTFYFQLNTDPAILRAFDNAYGTRTFDGVNAWDGDDGWTKFLNFSLGNLVQNDLRQEIGKVTCSDLLPSCALVQNNVAGGAAAVIPTDGKGNQTITQVQEAINKSFAADVVDNLGGPYLVNVKFVLSKVVPPQPIQDAITTAQAAFAKNATSTALQQQATIDKQTNIIKQQGYDACAVCAQIDELKALPSGITTYAPGQGFAVTGK